MSNLYLYKRKADLIIYHIQTNEQLQLSDKSIHDIHSNMYQAVTEEIANNTKWNENWHEGYLELKRKGFPLKWNELRIKLARMKTEEADEVLNLMWRLDDGQSIR